MEGGNWNGRRTGNRIKVSDRNTDLIEPPDRSHESCECLIDINLLLRRSLDIETIKRPSHITSLYEGALVSKE
jgi:hypothetical protein